MARADGADTRVRIVETAVRLFADGGASGTGMRELAEASDLTLPGLYYHFKSKQELVRAIFEHQADRLLSTGPADKLASKVRDRILQQATADLVEMKDDFVRLAILEAIGTDADAIETLSEIRNGWEARWTKILSGASDLSPRADTARAAGIVTTGLLGIHLLHMCGITSTTAAMVRDLAEVVGSALAASK